MQNNGILNVSKMRLITIKKIIRLTALVKRFYD